MATRSKTASEQPLSADELAFRQKHLAEKDKRLRDERNALELEREASHAASIQKDKLLAELAELRLTLDREREQARLDSVTRKSELADLRRALSEAETDPRSRLSPRAETNGYEESGNSYTQSSSENPSFGLREALETVPTFDGTNIPVLQFARICKHAREIICPQAERTFTKLLLTKLRGRAYAVVEDEDLCTVASLCNLLKEIFGVNHSVDHYRGKLADIFMHANEHIIDFVSRVKDLRTAIIDASRDHVSIKEIDELALNSFTNGLIPTLRTEIKIFRPRSLAEAYAEAIRLFKQYKTDEERYSRRRDNTPPSSRPSPRPPPRQDVPRQNLPRHDTDRRSHPTPNSRIKFCNYCKNSGHDIHECRKREFVNQRSGNEIALPSTSSDRREVTHRVLSQTVSDDRLAQESDE